MLRAKALSKALAKGEAEELMDILKVGEFSGCETPYWRHRSCFLVEDGGIWMVLYSWNMISVN